MAVFNVGWVRGMSSRISLPGMTLQSCPRCIISLKIITIESFACSQSRLISERCTSDTQVRDRILSRCREPTCSSAGLHVTLPTNLDLFLPASSDLDIPSSAMLARYRLFSLLLFPGFLKPKSNYSVETNISLPSATSPFLTTIPRLNTSEPECWDPPESSGYVFEAKPE